LVNERIYYCGDVIDKIQTDNAYLAGIGVNRHISGKGLERVCRTLLALIVANARYRVSGESSKLTE